MQRRGAANIRWYEYAFLALGLVAALVTDSLTLARLLKLGSLGDPDFAYGILLLVHSGLTSPSVTSHLTSVLSLSAGISDHRHLLSTHDRYCCLLCLGSDLDDLRRRTLLRSTEELGRHSTETPTGQRRTMFTTDRSFSALDSADLHRCFQPLLHSPGDRRDQRLSTRGILQTVSVRRRD